MQFSSQNLYKFGFSTLSSGSLAALLLSLGASHASAQITIQSTGTISGTLEFPFGPTTNGRVTRVDTDSNGTYFRNIGTRSNPNLVPVYSSKFVQIQTNPDGSIKSFVDFLGLQFISSDGSITSPVFSGGKLRPYRYQGRPDPRFLVNFQAAVQDELALQRAFYEGIVTDPKTGQQYQGVFEVNGQGPRYSDRNGGDSPTVFDFKTDYDPKSGIRPQPALNSYKMTNVPLVRLTITVPSGMQPINPTTGGTPVSTPGGTPGGTTGGTPGSTPGGTTGGGTTAPISTPGNITLGGTTVPISTPGGMTGGTSPTPIGTTGGTVSGTAGGTVSAGNTAAISASDAAPIINAVSPSTQPNVEFSSGSSVALNSDSAIRVSAACSRDSVNCRSTNQSKQIGPRSRVLVR